MPYFFYWLFIDFYEVDKPHLLKEQEEVQHRDTKQEIGRSKKNNYGPLDVGQSTLNKNKRISTLRERGALSELRGTQNRNILTGENAQLPSAIDTQKINKLVTLKIIEEEPK